MHLRKWRIKRLRQYCAHILDRDVFRKVRFLDKETRDIVYDSYILNIPEMIEYAKTHHFDIVKYFQSIRLILLEDKNVRERDKCKEYKEKFMSTQIKDQEYKDFVKCPYLNTECKLYENYILQVKEKEDCPFKDNCKLRAMAQKNAQQR